MSGENAVFHLFDLTRTEINATHSNAELGVKCGRFLKVLELFCSHLQNRAAGVQRSTGETSRSQERCSGSLEAGRVYQAGGAGGEAEHGAEHRT